MPIYEYTCASCGHDHEAMQKMSDAPLVECPACGKPQLKKRISAAGFRLKGSGWYETDFKGGSKKKEAAEKDVTEKKDTPATATKEDSKKPAEKSESSTTKTGTGE